MIELVLVLAVVAGLVWFFRGAGTHVWRVRFQHGRVVEVDGALPARVRAALEDVAHDARVTGEVRLDGSERLRFSRTIGEAQQQRFRNVWATVR